MTTIWLYVLSGEELGRVETFQTSALTIGRGGDAHMRLDSSTVSRHHARLQVANGGRVWIKDLDSTSGTFVAGDRVTSAEIQPGAILRIADVELRVRVEYEEPAGSDDGDAGMELEGEWEEGVATKAPTAPMAAPAPAAPMPKRAQPSAKDLRRAQQVGDLQGASTSAKTSGRKRVLQYSQHSTSYGIGGGELSQRAPWQKTLAVVVAIALFAGLAYGAFYLTQTARSTRAESVEAR